jgi:DNA-binding NarL/FixJ family response regulator
VLVAQGKANKEIAGELMISERTARTHVSNILAKLGLSSRTQAALWAVRAGLAAPPG